MGNRRLMAVWSIIMAAGGLPAAAQGVADLGSAIRSTSDAPKLIVLMHGGSPRPDAEVGPFVPEPNSNSLDFTRFYFGYDFVRRLMGVSRATGLKTLSGHNLKDGGWDRHGPPNSKGKVQYTVGAEESDLADHFVVPGSYTGSATPPLSLMITYRDASKGLMTQSKTLVNQIHDLYTRQFGTAAAPKAGKTLPNIIFVTHSMGGIAIRTILTAPSEPIQGVSMTADERRKAGVIRNRTLYAVTIAAPHEGSPLADRAHKVVNAVESMHPTITGAINLLTIGLYDGIRKAIKNSLGNDEIRDLTQSLWGQLNRGVLAPHRAARSDGTLIPIYTLIGHTPGGDYYDDPEKFPGGGLTLDSFKGAETRNAFRSVFLMFVDYLLYNVAGEGPKSWGRTNDRGLDKVARYHRKALGLALSAPGEDQGLPLGFPKFYSRRHLTRREKPLFGPEKTVVVRTNRDRQIDSDGHVSVTSGHGFNLGSRDAFFFDHSRNWPTAGGDLGSWYRLSSDENPWEFTNHETIHRSAGTGAWLFENIIREAGPITSTADISVWMPAGVRLGPRVSKSDLAAVRVKAAGIRLKRGNIADD